MEPYLLQALSMNESFTNPSPNIPPVSSLKFIPSSISFVHPTVRLFSFSCFPFAPFSMIVSVPKNPFADDPSAYLSIITIKHCTHQNKNEFTNVRSTLSRCQGISLAEMSKLIMISNMIDSLDYIHSL